MRISSEISLFLAHLVPIGKIKNYGHFNRLYFRSINLLFLKSDEEFKHVHISSNIVNLKHPGRERNQGPKRRPPSRQISFKNNFKKFSEECRLSEIISFSCFWYLLLHLVSKINFLKCSFC